MAIFGATYDPPAYPRWIAQVMADVRAQGGLDVDDAEGGAE